MATINKFEDLEIWQEARELHREIYNLTKAKCFLDYPDLKWQMRRSSGSIMDNVAEGFERGGKGEFIQFLSVSKGSNGELKSQLYKCLDLEFISNKDFEYFYAKTENISKKIGSFINYLNKTNIRGNKYPKK
jgi:four helix bundle protein